MSRKGTKWGVYNKIERFCKYCNKSFFVFPYKIVNNRGKFCSKQCKYKFGHTQESKIKMSNSLKKRFILHPEFITKGENVPNWKGGRLKTGLGYIKIWQPHHPFPDCRGYVFEHRLTMEKYLKRFLTKKEVIHHINDNPSDNRIENLKLFTNNKEHIKFHRFKKST